MFRRIGQVIAAEMRLLLERGHMEKLWHTVYVCIMKTNAIDYRVYGRQG